MDTIAQKTNCPKWLFPLTVAAAAGAHLVSPLYLVVPALIAATLMYIDRPAIRALLSLPGYGFAFLLYSGGERAALLSAIFLATIGYIGGFVLYSLQKRKQGGFHTAAVLSAIAIASLYLSICLDGLISGAGAFASTEAYANLVAEQTLEMLRSGAIPNVQELLPSYEAYFEDFGEVVVSMLVPALCIFGSVIGLVNTLMFRLFVRRDREALGLSPFRPLHAWSIPKDYSIGISVLLVGSMILMFMETEFAESVSMTVITLVSVPLFVQAIALIDWFIVRKGKNIAAKRAFMGVLIAVLFGSVSNILVTLGIFEQIFQARTHFTDMGMGIQPPESKEEEKK